MEIIMKGFLRNDKLEIIDIGSNNLTNQVIKNNKDIWVNCLDNLRKN
jgi:hypothetical protein